MASNETIYTGLWIDWSHGRVFGTTVTLSPRGAAILNAFLAVLLSFTGTQLWKILAYTIHQRAYRRAYTDALGHQQRLLLRNSSDPGPTLWNLMLQYVSWGKPFRILPLATFALIYMIAVAALSILVPSHLHADAVRLLTPNNCGYKTTSNDTTRFTANVLKKAQEGSLHSQNCYEVNSGPVCEGFPVLNTTFTPNVTCPFDSSICYRSDGAVPLLMQTPLLHSRDDLGIDVADHVTFRTALTCSLISRTNHVDIAKAAATGGLADLVQYHYGWADNGVNTGGPVNNITFVYSELSSVLNPTYSIGLVYYLAPGYEPLWRPIPELNRTDADVTLVFFQNNAVWASKPILDPMYKSVNHPIMVNPDNTTVNNTEYYESAFYASLIGCANQYQLCNPHNGACSQLGGWNTTFPRYSRPQLGWTTLQQKVVDRLQFATPWNQLYTVIGTRSGFALRATATLSSQIQLGLPDNQYLIEMKSWFTTGLSMMQKATRDFASSDTPGVLFDVYDQAMCSTQRTLDSEGTVSFSVLWLLVVALLCVAVIALSYVLEPIVSLILSRRAHKSRTATALWQVDNVLQLQRRLFEALGYARFSDSDWVPVTSDRPFGELDFRNYKSPKFTEHVDSPQVDFQDTDKRVQVTGWEMLNPGSGQDDHTYVSEQASQPWRQYSNYNQMKG